MGSVHLISPPRVCTRLDGNLLLKESIIYSRGYFAGGVTHNYSDSSLNMQSTICRYGSGSEQMFLRMDVSIKEEEKQDNSKRSAADFVCKTALL